MLYKSSLKESKQIYYHRDKDFFDINKPYSFYTKDKAYAMKFSRQYRIPKIYTVELNSSANIYPEPIWYKDWENILKWNPKHDPRFKDYDAVPIIEPNGEEGSIVVLNPKILKLIKVEDSERVEW